MTLTQILQKIKSTFYTKTEIDTSLSSKANTSDLTTHTSNSDIHVTSTDKTTWNAKQSALSTAQLNACNSGITSTKVSSYDTHVANSDVHVTTSDKSTWNAKQNALSTTQLSACNSGITSDKVAQYDGYASTKVNKAGDTMTGSLIAPSFVANNIDCSVDSRGDGWIRYSNGLQICWDKITWQDTCDRSWSVFYETSAKNKAFPKPFLSNTVPCITYAGDIGYACFVENKLNHNNTSTPLFWICSPLSKSETLNCKINYIAIGKWK